ncbi:TPA: hypothetical protein HA335_03220 [Methanocaldococcus jannaschii]|uniref:Uncharacterized protein MJ0627 n=2 Tax=Methanocaldococcus jannaschii TaxID=2190 RepID=Y627_METJA|nr:hypothetical protein [Methanocaldococcus jannaschii]Q58044.1 RecName: Full=Uncharacterized protein MJ0627 [Methanocaldococcus jannaschii DSM 2661]AAB98626.1 hypothetical protein MJ_0627 [Methanocaldococcus jannaschii DSM 2661]HII59581.1 hypothetical protein [Methanocaldococcus jannaschii]
MEIDVKSPDLIINTIRGNEKIYFDKSIFEESLDNKFEIIQYLMKILERFLKIYDNHIKEIKLLIDSENHPEPHLIVVIKFKNKENIFKISEQIENKIYENPKSKNVLVYPITGGTDV